MHANTFLAGLFLYHEMLTQLHSVFSVRQRSLFLQKVSGLREVEIMKFVTDCHLKKTY